jgi:hypothetical protein
LDPGELEGKVFVSVDLDWKLVELAIFFGFFFLFFRNLSPRQLSPETRVITLFTVQLSSLTPFFKPPLC